MILKYYCIVTSLEGINEDFGKQIIVDYILNADIKYELCNYNIFNNTVKLINKFFLELYFILKAFDK